MPATVWKDLQEVRPKEWHAYLDADEYARRHSYRLQNNVLQLRKAC